MRQLAARRIFAIPSLIKMPLPTRTVANDCCLRILLSRPRRNCFELCCWLLLQSGLTPSLTRFFVGGFRGLRIYEARFRVGRFRGLRICEAFMNFRFEFPVSLYTFGYSVRASGWMSFILANDLSSAFSERVDSATVIKRCEMFALLMAPKCGGADARVLQMMGKAKYSVTRSQPVILRMRCGELCLSTTQTG